MLAKLEKKVKDMFDKADSDYIGEPWFFKMHIKPVMNLAIELAKKYNANNEVVEAAACLHDIGLIGTTNKKNHAKQGVEKARKMLSEMNCDSKFISKVCECIETHMSDKKLPQTKEAKIVSTADGLSHLITNWFKTKRKYDNKTASEYKRWCTKKIKSDLKKIQFPDEKIIAERASKNLIKTL
jgi:putative nucleotidyltransferase with HDIG domain